jgi:hypothetical protein
MLQTVRVRGFVNKPNVGPMYNVVPGKMSSRSCCGMTYDVLYTILCFPCAVGIAMQSVGMPCWFGACCVNPISGASILRYHHNILPWLSNEGVTDCWFPCIFDIIAAYFSGYHLAEYIYACGILTEENVRHNRDGCYGCNCIGATVYTCRYLCTCTCTESEGKYLHRDEIAVDTGKVVMATVAY